MTVAQKEGETGEQSVEKITFRTVMYWIFGALLFCLVLTAFIEYGHYIIDFLVNSFNSFPQFLKTFFKVLGVTFAVAIFYGFLIFIISVSAENRRY